MRIVLLSLCACSLLSAADQVVLKNGDIITGTVIKKDGDKLTLKSEFLGEVTMPWSAVKSTSAGVCEARLRSTAAFHRTSPSAAKVVAGCMYL